MKRSLLVVLMVAAMSLAHSAEEPAVDLALKPGTLEIRPSFETCSYYFRPPAGAAASEYRVEFRRVGEQPWRRGLEAVSDQPAGVWKGSLFGLDEDSAWQLRVVARGDTPVAQGEFRTWSSRPRIARVVDLSQLDPDGKGGIVISDRGAEDGWIKFTAPKGWVLQHKPASADPPLAAITFKNARHVILENVVIVGGLRYAILVQECEAVRILNCDLSGWGRVGVQQFENTGNRGKYVDPKGEFINLDGGVAINRSWGTVVERCYIHDPRGRANSWMFQHPTGPTAVHVNSARGGTVLRWNDMIGSDEHRWNDVIEASSNASRVGGFYRDSDVAGNFLAFGNDDGVELEGGGMNVRFYRNKIEGTTCGVSTGACLLGPQYVIGNLVANPGDESGLSLMLFKNSHGVQQAGRRYFVNNTLYGLDCAAYGSYGKPAPGARIGFMRNNVFVCNGTRVPGEWGRSEDFDHDLFWVRNDLEASRGFLAAFQSLGQELRGTAADPRLAGPERGDFQLAADSVGRGAAVAVANVCPAGVDLGAFYGGFDEVPHRPLELHTQPRQLNFDGSREGVRLNVVLTVPARARQALKFQIRQNRAFDWFKVAPAAGEIGPGDALTLAVTVDPAKLKGRPLFKGAFLVRTPEGLSRPVTVYARGEFKEELRPPEAPNTVYLEAASMPGVAGLVGTTDAPTVFGGKYVALSGAAGEPALDAGFNLARAGNYSLLARVAIDGDLVARRGFELAVDKAEKPAAFNMNDDYQWNVSDRRFRVVYLYALGELSPGHHALRLRTTNGNIKVNELIVTDNPGVFFAQYWQRERSE